MTCVETYESCASPGDEDGDGAVDCEDEDCINTATCAIGAEACGNKIDDDGDGELDCEDDDCANNSQCQAQPEDCSNETDDDSDGDADCADSDCANTSACVDGGERCGSGADEDGDGRIDCADTDCAYTRACIGTLEICTNGIDDDADGAADCADPECEGAVVCLNRREDCTNRIDDDGDADIDCADADCAAEPVCADEICDNGVDDDGDGNADCKDYDCVRDDTFCSCDNLADVDNDDVPNCTDEDIDGDGLPNDQDNCDFVENTDQTDEDGDGVGDVCEADLDADGIIDDEDNCPDVFNPNQQNQDADAVFTFDIDFPCGSPPDLYVTIGGSVIGGATPDPVVSVTRTVDSMGNADASGRVFVFDGANLPTGSAATAAVELSGPVLGEEIGSLAATDGDFDGDGVADLVVTSRVSQKVYLWKGVSGGTISGSPDAEFIGPDSLGGAVTMGFDFDQDGIQDLITAGPGGNTSTYRMLRIVSGRALSGATTPIDVSDGISVRNTNEHIGGSLNIDLDVDGDGLRDVLIGADSRYYLMLTPRRTAP
jgi:hypothetical protein